MDNCPRSGMRIPPPAVDKAAGQVLCTTKLQMKRSLSWNCTKRWARFLGIRRIWPGRRPSVVFGSLTVAPSGFLGILAAIYQANRIPWPPMEQIEDYVALWSAVAALSLLAVGVELVYSYSAAMSTLRRRLTTHAIRQFVPCLVAGAANRGDHRSRARDRLDVARIVVFAFRTRRFASSRSLPRPIVWVLDDPLLLLAPFAWRSARGNSLSPWMMAATFGFGQLLAALILYCTLERGDEEIEA